MNNNQALKRIFRLICNTHIESEIEARGKPTHTILSTNSAEKEQVIKNITMISFDGTWHDEDDSRDKDDIHTEDVTDDDIDDSGDTSDPDNTDTAGPSGSQCGIQPGRPHHYD